MSSGNSLISPTKLLWLRRFTRREESWFTFCVTHSCSTNTTGGSASNSSRSDRRMSGGLCGGPAGHTGLWNRHSGCTGGSNDRTTADVTHPTN